MASYLLWKLGQPGLGPGEVQDGVEGQGLIVRLGPTTETLLVIGTHSIQASTDEGQRVEQHGIPSWPVGGGGPDYTMKSWPKSKNVGVF